MIINAGKWYYGFHLKNTQNNAFISGIKYNEIRKMTIFQKVLKMKNMVFWGKMVKVTKTMDFTQIFNENGISIYSFSPFQQCNMVNHSLLQI